MSASRWIGNPVRHFPLVFLLFICGARAQEAAIACPATLTVPAGLPVVAGWQALRAQGEARPLERIAIRHGADAASPAVPQSHYLREERGERKTIVAGWDLAPARQGPDLLWLACVYAGTVIELVRPLPASISACEYRVEYSGDALREAGSCR